MKAELRIVAIDPDSTKLIETHEIEFESMQVGGAYTAVKKVLGQWMEDDDRLVSFNIQVTDDGKNLQPWIIQCAGSGEASDIFGQLIWEG